MNYRQLYSIIHDILQIAKESRPNVVCSYCNYVANINSSIDTREAAGNNVFSIVTLAWTLAGGILQYRLLYIHTAVAIYAESIIGTKNVFAHLWVQLRINDLQGKFVAKFEIIIQSLPRYIRTSIISYAILIVLTKKSPELVTSEISLHWEPAWVSALHIQHSSLVW